MRMNWTQGRGIWYHHHERQRYSIIKQEDHLNSMAGVYRYHAYQNSIHTGASFPSLVACQMYIEDIAKGATT